MRADAQRNREKVLQAASAAFAAEGLGVPVQEIARRAGVGTGTVSRHFPTKESLFEAVVLSRVEPLIDRARSLTATRDAGDAFFEFFAHMVDQGALDRGLAEAFAGAGFDMEGAALKAGYDVGATFRELLTRAQQAGAVRPDVDITDVKALMFGCLTRERGQAEPAARDRVVTVVRDGLRAHPAQAI
ncbi:TetR/AcrR family transcriptional regulator [Peterkaempfera griseoplana]|uniref:TetR/AcrR family transcriptional regulator n=1 Tax=Peterkaempfera griseoplana TaxID=66896 RepID=UPI0006E2A7EC|nr:TetR/AcrR family transcriptional regulator [Peterkaempfera griseoplana]